MARIENPLQDFGGSCAIGLWRITETEEEFCGICPELLFLKERVGGMKSRARRLEYLAVRALLKDMTGSVPEIHHDENGKPYLDGGKRISISHTRGYAAVILSDDSEVAIDIEYVSDRVCRVADRFLRNDEEASTTQDKLVAWCAKETLYKLHSADHLSFDEMRMNGVPAADGISTGNFRIENLRRGCAVDMRFAINGSFTLVCAVEKSR